MNNMQPTLKGAPLAQTARQFIATIKATKFTDTLDLQNLLDVLPAVHLRPGYSLGWYREGDFMGTHVHLYPFRTGSTDEYDPGIHNRDIENKHLMVFEEFDIHMEKESDRKLVDWDRTYFLTKYYC